VKIKDQEIYLQQKALRQLTTLVITEGYSISIKSEVPSTFTELRGIEAGNSNSFTNKTVTGILIGDDFISIDNASAGMFTEGYLYTLDDVIIKVGDIVIAPRNDTRIREYKVVSYEGLGTTTNIMFKYKLAAIESE